MAKLKLELEELTVETFGTEDTAREGGTVFGHTGDQCISWDTCEETCEDMGCGGGNSGGWTCDGSTCAYSCGGGCDDSASTTPCICF